MATKPQPKTPVFEDILDVPSNEIVRPPPIPHGDYIGTIRGMYEEVKSKEKQTRGHKYTVQLIEPLTDKDGNNINVDPEALELALTKPNGDVGALRDRTLPLTLWVTENSMPRYKDFLTDLGIPEKDDDGTFLSTKQRAELSPGRSLIVTVTHSPSPDGTAVYANITSTAVLPEE